MDKCGLHLSDLHVIQCSDEDAINYMYNVCINISLLVAVFTFMYLLLLTCTCRSKVLCVPILIK